MKAREMAAEYRMAYWAGKMKRKTETGQNVRRFCETEGIHENTYYYWQRKLREKAYEIIKSDTGENPTGNKVPDGWALCVTDGTTKANPSAKAVGIEIGKSKINVTPETDIETLTKVCRVLVRLC